MIMRVEISVKKESTAETRVWAVEQCQVDMMGRDRIQVRLSEADWKQLAGWIDGPGR
mgnify:CR=1 FL=1